MSRVDWHTELPPSTEEVWDIVAKVLLIRLGGSVCIPQEEARMASEASCEISMDDAGSFYFRRTPN